MTEYFKVFGGALSGFYALLPSFGLAIILLTVAVRVILLPLSIKQTRSMREMQRIQPEIKKLQAKHKGNRQKMNEELMALYKEHGVNPFGGCAPLLLQFPVLIGLFYVIRSPLDYMTGTKLAEDLVQHKLAVHQFLGLRLDCSSSAAIGGADPSNVGAVCGNGFASALPYLVLVLLMGFTTYYQQKQMQASRGQGDPQAAQMQMVMKIMPFMLMVFAFNFPAGVVIYWLTTNVWTIGQQRIMINGLPGWLGGGARPAGASSAEKSATPAPGQAASTRKPSQKGRAAGGAKAAGSGSGRSSSSGGNGKTPGAAPVRSAHSKKKKR